MYDKSPSGQWSQNLAPSSMPKRLRPSFSQFAFSFCRGDNRFNAFRSPSIFWGYFRNIRLNPSERVSSYVSSVCDKQCLITNMYSCSSECSWAKKSPSMIRLRNRLSVFVSFLPFNSILLMLLSQKRTPSVEAFSGQI